LLAVETHPGSLLPDGLVRAEELSLRIDPAPVESLLDQVKSLMRLHGELCADSDAAEMALKQIQEAKGAVFSRERANWIITIM